MTSLEEEILVYQESVDYHKKHLSYCEKVLTKLKDALTITDKQLEDDVKNKTSQYITVSLEKQEYLFYNKKNKLVTHNKLVAIVNVSDGIYLLKQIPTIYNNHTTINQELLIKRLVRDLYQVERVILNYNSFRYEQI